MSRSELHRLLAERVRVSGRPADEAVDDWSTLTVDAIDRLVDENLRSGIEYLTGQPAPLTRSLSLRFTGALNARGALPSDVTEAVVGAVSDSVRAAGSPRSEGLGLDLVGVGSGSTILYFAPASDVVDPSDELQVEDDPLDRAMAEMFELHGLAENRGDLRRFAGQADLLKGFRRLADTLEGHQLEMSMRWRGAGGRRLSAQLSRDTLTWVSSVWEVEPVREPKTVTGRITSLSITGSFAIKVAPQRNAKRYQVHVGGGEDELIGLNLALGETVTVRIDEVTDRNKLGVITATRYELLGFDQRQQELP